MKKGRSSSRSTISKKNEENEENEEGGYIDGVENEEYDMGGLTEDYMDGNYQGEEEENPEDYN